MLQQSHTIKPNKMTKVAIIPEYAVEGNKAADAKV